MSSTKLGRKRAAAVISNALITIAGGALDTWVYLAHGHVFANAQTGNVARRRAEIWYRRAVTSLAAFVAGVFISRQTGDVLKDAELNWRDIRLGVECVLLAALGFLADTLSDHVVIACVGFIAGLQITSLSHIGSWSFNTGMTTGTCAGRSVRRARSLPARRRSGRMRW